LVFVRILTLASFLLIPAGASALIIDSFDDAAATTANSGSSPDTTNTLAGSFLGTDRDLTAVWASGPNDIDGEIDSGGSSQLSFAAGPDTIGDIYIDWNNIGGADLAEGATKDGIALTIDFDDLPVDVSIMVEDGGGNMGTSGFTTPGGIFVPTSQGVTFNSFSGSVDFTDVENISLWIEGVFGGTDIQIDFIESTVVPEPSLLALFGIAGLAVAGRKRIRS
jgi:hypothetical protein